MNMRKARRIRNNRISHERRHVRLQLIHEIGSRSVSRVNARSPTPINDFSHFLPPFPNVAGPQRLHARQEARILDHESHELRRVAANTIKLEPVAFYESFERRVRSKPHTMAVAPEYFSESDEGLDVTA
jgi:hypothetical protein